MRWNKTLSSCLIKASMEVVRSEKLKELLTIILAFGNYFNYGKRGSILCAPCVVCTLYTTEYTVFTFYTHSVWCTLYTVQWTMYLYIYNVLIHVHTMYIIHNVIIYVIQLCTFKVRVRNEANLGTLCVQCFGSQKGLNFLYNEQW